MIANNLGHYNSWEEYEAIQDLEKQKFEENQELIQKLLKEGINKNG